MIPTLLLPAGLAALAALLLPLLLHLVRREDRRPIDFAALRWLSARVRPRRSVRFEEWLLLALRLLLLTLLALLLARPVLFGGGEPRPWIVALPGVGVEMLAGATLSTTDVRPREAERRWLVPGFPIVDTVPPPAASQPVSSLLRELDLRMPADAPLVVLAPRVLEGVDAERPRLSRPVDWRVVEAIEGVEATEAAGAAPGLAVTALQDARDPPPNLLIRNAGSDAGARYLHAAATAWRAEDAASGEGGDGDEGDEVRAWLAPGTLPAAELAWVQAGGTALLAHDTALPDAEHATALWTDADGRTLLRGVRHSRGRLLQWMQPLRPEAMPGLLDPDFPQRLRAALQPPPAPSRVLAAEHAPLVGDVGPWPQAARELSPWLALAIALLFLIERWIAAGPRRGRAA